MRITDIFRKSTGSHSSFDQDTTTPSFPIPEQPVIDEILALNAKASFSLYAFGSIPAEAIPRAAASALYEQALREARALLGCSGTGTPFKEALRSATLLADYIAEGKDDLLLLADRATPDNYLYGHSVNTAIIALVLGRAMNLEANALRQLAICALLHDTGTAKVAELVNRGGKLSGSELLLVRSHQNNAQEIFELLPQLEKEAKAVIAETMLYLQDRFSPSPASPRPGNAHLFSRCIAVADTYEAISHPRPWRGRYLPHEALKMMIAAAGPLYDTAALKAFIERISIYPPGSFVRLNTEEIACVAALNPGLPTRPRVQVITDPSGRRLTTYKTTDLSVTPIIFITEAVDETKVPGMDPAFCAELKALRWWVRGI